MAVSVVVVEFLWGFAGVDLDGVHGRDHVTRVQEVVVECENAGEKSELVENTRSVRFRKFGLFDY